MEVIRTGHTRLLRAGGTKVQVLEQRFPPAGGQDPWELQLFRQRSPEMLAQLEAEALPAPPIHETLRRFGYDLRPAGARQTLYRQGRAVLDDMPAGEPRLALSPTGEDFAFVTPSSQGAVLVRRSGLIRGDWQTDYPPVFAGKDLVGLQAQYPPGHITRDQPIPWSVWREGQIVQRLEIPENGANPRVKRLSAWESHWVLEVEGRVLVDRQWVGVETGAAEVFDWHLLRGRPFYFYRLDHGVFVSYDGVTLPLAYDDVVHYRCCEPSFYNPAATGSSISFWARRDNRWHFMVLRPLPTTFP